MPATISEPEVSVPAADRKILRALASELAAFATDPVYEQKAALWRSMNDLRSVRPMVWINEIPWHEMDTAGELTLRCSNPWARLQESHLRRTIYQWRYLPADMIPDNFLSCPLAIHNTGFGIEEDVAVARTDPNNAVFSRQFHIQIAEEKDLSKIKLPVVTHDEAATEANYQRMCDIYEGVIPVRKEGIRTIWYTPWDNLIRWWGIEEAMLDLVDRPELIHEAVDRCVASMQSGLDQMEKLNLLAFGSNNTRVGSGGYGYASELPRPGFDPGHVRAIDDWGCSNAQIFSEVSPEMHWEFALRHDIPWLERWGLNYYGCCEPLDFKLDILRRIPRLRKISMNYRIKDIDRAVEDIGTDYVFSYKPNPAFLAGDRWRPDLVREELTAVLDKTRGCHVEIIMKDISTVCYQPQRLWEWQRIAMELVENFNR